MRPNPSSRRRPGQLGATLVEYALLVAVFAVGTMAAVQFLQDSAERKTERTAEAISTRTIPELPDHDGGGGGGGGGGGATTAPPQATTVDAAWTSTSRSTSGSNWRANADLTVRNNLGQPVSGAVVKVKVATKRGNNSWQNLSGTIDATTGSAGSLTFRSSWYAQSGGSRIDQVRFTVQSLSAPGLTYVSGSVATIVSRT